jgi:hypothetical protein
MVVPDVVSTAGAPYKLTQYAAFFRTSSSAEQFNHSSGFYGKNSTTSIL